MADLAVMLRLADWTIRVDWSAPAADNPGQVSLASIQPAPWSKHATLRLGATFLSLTEAEQRQVLCHELVHCHLFALHELGRSHAGMLTGRGSTAVAQAALEQQVELATDALADVLAPFAPRLDLDRPAATLRA